MMSKWDPNEANRHTGYNKNLPEISIWSQTEAHMHEKTEPYIMEAIMHETLKVFIRAAGFREAYCIYYIT